MFFHILKIKTKHLKNIITHVNIFMILIKFVFENKYKIQFTNLYNTKRIKNENI